jgi:transcriptional regulator with XRE-family HTH domain
MNDNSFYSFNSLDKHGLLYIIIQRCTKKYNKKEGEKMPLGENFGIFFKEKRRKLGLTLREFCRINGFDAGNISKLERGLLSPPQSREKRLQYAKALEITERSDDWLQFCDLATTSAGKIPPDIISNKELMNALPVLFRTARRRNLNEEDLKKLVEVVKRELR